MKIKVVEKQEREEIHIIIECKKQNKQVEEIQRALEKMMQTVEKLVFYKDGKEYYLPLEEILFFETTQNEVSAHTKQDVYLIKYRLYELEELLPKHFVRVAKATILNCNHIYSIDKNLTSSSIVKFNESYKQVYVSRFYYKELKRRLAERREN